MSVGDHYGHYAVGVLPGSWSAATSHIRLSETPRSKNVCIAVSNNNGQTLVFPLPPICMFSLLGLQHTRFAERLSTVSTTAEEVAGQIQVIHGQAPLGLLLLIVESQHLVALIQSLDLWLRSPGCSPATPPFGRRSRCEKRAIGWGSCAKDDHANTESVAANSRVLAGKQYVVGVCLPGAAPEDCSIVALRASSASSSGGATGSEDALTKQLAPTLPSVHEVPTNFCLPGSRSGQ